MKMIHKTITWKGFITKSIGPFNVVNEKTHTDFCVEGVLFLLSIKDTH